MSVVFGQDNFLLTTNIFIATVIPSHPKNLFGRYHIKMDHVSIGWPDEYKNMLRTYSDSSLFATRGIVPRMSYITSSQ